jgi:hypothetical protein
MLAQMFDNIQEPHIEAFVRVVVVVVAVQSTHLAH